MNKLNYFDVSWIIALFGTAVGAGILFLPLRAGLGGFWPVFILTLLAIPVTYLSHKALCRFIGRTHLIAQYRHEQEVIRASQLNKQCCS